MDKYNELVTKLKEIFQIDRPDLDFGIYRILNSKSSEISEFLDKRLKEKVQESLKLSKEDSNDTDSENKIYSHLITFFSRYYDNGDFISQRRYKGDTYAIPYAGEEVMLHWANKDQYYTKSGENFSNYSFKLEDGRKVHFKLVVADTAKDNRKDNGETRCFTLISKSTVISIDKEGEEYEKILLPIEETVVDGVRELILRFEYKAFPSKSKVKQNEQTQKAIDEIVSNKLVKNEWSSVLSKDPIEKNLNRTLLEKHLNVYTTKNSADYFIHKDLSGFLKRELDFYIKNEVMNLDDIQNIISFSETSKNFKVIQCLREVALSIIGFLGQLEEFQKKLWLKKKYVVSSEYSITLNQIDEKHYDTILKNEKQWNEWRKLAMISSTTKASLKELETNKFLVVDTSLYDSSFKYKLLMHIKNLDDNENGILIHSDNFQALSFLENRYKKQIKYVYIDPPYNTKSTPIIYKNSYKHSSWASLMQDRLFKSFSLLSDDGIKTVAIDDTEVTNLSLILENLAPELKLSRVTVISNPKGSITTSFNRVHEYALFLTNDSNPNCRIARTLEENDSPRRMRRWGENSLRTERRQSFYPIYLKNGKIVRIGQIPEDNFHPHGKNVKLKNGEIEVWPIDQNGIERRWNFGLESINDNLDRIVAIDVDGVMDLFVSHEQTVPKTVWSGGEYDAGKYGNSLLIDILGTKKFDFPKSINLVKKCVYVSTENNKNCTILDYFGGSGTTGHAVISLNRQDNGKRKFILVEQGEYFETVTKPRIQKIIYSPEWAEGKPTTIDQGTSHFIKVIKLESYEDTLNNLEIRRNRLQESALGSMKQEGKDNYLLHYMLNLESRASILSVDKFKKPFNYKLKVSIDTAGAFEERNIDLVETFNYLIGLKTQRIIGDLDRGFLACFGTLPDNKRVLILWRDCDILKPENIEKILIELIAQLEVTFEVIYINGDNTLAVTMKSNKKKLGIEIEPIILQIEPEFLSKMFEVEGH